MTREAESEAIDREIAAFSRMRTDLEVRYHGKFVVLKDAVFRGAFDTVAGAAVFARRNFGRGPYLIREVGVAYDPLPASVMWHPVADA